MTVMTTTTNTAATTTVIVINIILRKLKEIKRRKVTVSTIFSECHQRLAYGR